MYADGFGLLVFGAPLTSDRLAKRGFCQTEADIPIGMSAFTF